MPANDLPTITLHKPVIVPDDPAADGFTGRYIERATGRAFTHRHDAGEPRPHVLVTIDHGEGRPLTHQLGEADFQRLFEKD